MGTWTIVEFLLYLIELATAAVWSLFGTTSYGYWLVPICGFFVWWSRSKDRWSMKALRNAFIDALAAVVLVFVCVFLWELCWNIPHQIRVKAASIPPPTPFVVHVPPPPVLPSPLVSAQRVKPTVVTSYTIMPFDPPYPPDTVVAGIKFKPRTLDVRLFLSINHASIKNLDINIFLINTTGQILSILGLDQRTTFPNVIIAPVMKHNGSLPDSIRIADGGKGSTLPVGGTSSQGTLEKHAATWRIHCDELLADITPEFVLMVDRPYRTKMIEGFVVRGSYEYYITGKVKTGKIENITEFDDFGKSYVPSPQVVQTILKRYPPGHEPVGSVMQFNLPQPPNNTPPQ